MGQRDHRCSGVHSWTEDCSQRPQAGKHLGKMQRFICLLWALTDQVAGRAHNKFLIQWIKLLVHGDSIIVVYQLDRPKAFGFSSIIRINWNLELLVLRRGETRSIRRKASWNKGEKEQQPQSNFVIASGIRTRATSVWSEVSLLITAPSLSTKFCQGRNAKIKDPLKKGSRHAYPPFSVILCLYWKRCLKNPKQMKKKKFLLWYFQNKANPSTCCRQHLRLNMMRRIY